MHPDLANQLSVTVWIKTIKLKREEKKKEKKKHRSDSLFSLPSQLKKKGLKAVVKATRKILAGEWTETTDLEDKFHFIQIRNAYLNYIYPRDYIST